MELELLLRVIDVIRIALIRHSKTLGNTYGRYIGKTDEHLCNEGIELIKSKDFPIVEAVYSSPLLRCIETSRLIYPHLEPYIVDDLRECDFGDFENKNYKELEGNIDYQKWIDSNGKLPFPNGEDSEEFRKRSINAFDEVVNDAGKKNINYLALVVHGGTIMSVLDKYSYPHKDFYDWQVKNCCGYIIELEEDMKAKIIELI